MADLQRGHTFTDGSSGNDSADLHALIDLGTILPAFITGKTAVATLEDVDTLVVHDSSASALRKVTFANLYGSIPTDQAAGTASLRTLGTTSVKAAAGNDTRFPASVTGFRFGAGAGSNDLAATGKDFRFPVTISALDIDWDTGNQFYKSISGNSTFTFSNTRNGRAIVVVINLNGHTASFPSMDLGTLISLGSGTDACICYFHQTPAGISGIRFNV